MVRSIVLFSPFPRGERQRKTNDFHYLIIGEEVYWKTSPLTPLDASNSLRVGKFAIMVIGINKDMNTSGNTPKRR